MTTEDKEYHKKINENSAFASSIKDKDGHINTQDGLTKREWIATQVLSSLVSVSSNSNPSPIVKRALDITDELIRRLKE
tara:strand:+ start:1353 stop:1589 length:237 start_codon:yes stop_codon:yes gene_type:complete